MTEEQKTLASVTSLHNRQMVPNVEICLEDDEILAFVQGRLSPEGLAKVHGHVDSCELCQCLVAEAAHALEASPISESVRPSWNSVLRPNAMVDNRYRVIRLVARGGMGEVYEAYDTALQVRVALKTVTSTDCDNARAVQLLKAEVQLARRISHPNVCRIYDLGTHVLEGNAGEIQFLVMEFVDGDCLGKKIRQMGPLPLAEAYSIARDLLQGLQAAHDAGIMHRDFKSDNVILRRDSNGKFTPVILDFGLAKALNEGGSFATTQGHAMVGTIGYMAPEQIEGGPLSFASDIYAFGVVWFEMITGRLPFEGDTPIASAVARLSRPPKRASSFNEEVPSWLDEVIGKCLRRNPDDRFASAREVLSAIAGKEHLVAVRNSRRTASTLRRRVLFSAVGLVAASGLFLAARGQVKAIRVAGVPGSAAVSGELQPAVPASPVTPEKSPAAGETREAVVAGSEATEAVQGGLSETGKGAAPVALAVATTLKPTARRRSTAPSPPVVVAPASAPPTQVVSELVSPSSASGIVRGEPDWVLPGGSTKPSPKSEARAKGK